VQWQRPMQDFVYGEDFCPFIEEPTGSEMRRYHPGNYFSISCVAIAFENRRAAAGKIATSRLISPIILASVVNASSRRRRGLLQGDRAMQCVFPTPDDSWIVICFDLKETECETKNK